MRCLPPALIPDHNSSIINGQSVYLQDTMARTVDEAAHTKRREKFLDAAQRLIETKGYERMTIQDVLDNVCASKGAFYHYFTSKPALLEGLLVRLVDALDGSMVRCVNDDGLTALDKLHQFFAAMMRVSTEQRELVLAMLPVLFSDENAIVREKLRARISEQFAPLLGQIVEQGVEERVLVARDAEHVGRVAIGLLLDLDDTICRNLTTPESGRANWQFIERMVAAYIDALERVLGASSGSLALIDVAELQEWFDVSTNDSGHRGDRDSQGEQRWQRVNG